MPPDPQMQIRDIIRSQRPDLVRRLPAFVLRALESLLHQDQVNDFLSRHGHLDACAYMQTVLDELHASYTVRSAAEASSVRRAIYVSNHPSGGLDGVVLIHHLLGLHADLRVLANQVLKKVPPLAPLVVGVDKLGAAPRRRAARDLRQVLASDAPLLVFPAGEVAKLGWRGVREQGWSPSVLRWSQEHGRPIIPVHLSGGSSRAFHVVSVLRRALGLGFHVEMLWLIDALYKQDGAKVQVHIGRPFDADSRLHGRAQVEILRKVVLALPERARSPGAFVRTA